MKYRVFLFFFIITISYTTSNSISDEEHALMPPIVSLDPFESCLRRPGGRYCLVYASFVSDEPNSVLNLMKEYSSHKATHFNHTRAMFGTCLTQCKPDYRNISLNLKGALEACLNRSVQEKYNLRVKVEEIEPCQEQIHRSMHIGVAEKLVAGVLLALVGFNVVGSLLEIHFPKTNNSPVAQFLLCFSIPRNWKKLTGPPGGTDPRIRDLKGIYGIRAISTILVVLGHTFMPAIVENANSKFFEDQYDSVITHVILNGHLIMQIYLFLSAFLLIYNLQIYEEKLTVTRKMLLFSILRRLLRLTPAYAIVLGVTATWLQYSGSGPLWQKMVVSETMDCRRDWWKYLLYINNYVDNSDCMLFAWYLATDTQLYFLGIVVLVLCRTPRAKKLVLSVLFFMGMFITAFHTYSKDLDATLVVSPTAVFTLFKGDPSFNHLYKRGHTNIPSYILGMAFGYLIYHLQKNNVDVTSSRICRLLYWSVVPIGFGILGSCKVFYEAGPRMSIQYRVLISTFIKPVVGLITGLLFAGMILKIERVYRGFLEWSGWIYPARVSYSAYLIHMIFLRTASGAVAHTVHTSYRRMAEISLFFTLVVYIAATVFWVMVEAPLAQVVKTFLELCHVGPKLEDGEKPPESHRQLKEQLERKKK